MALECNIDAAGKYVRLLLGISTIIVSIPLVLITVFGVIDQTLGLVVIFCMWAGGSFTIFEGLTGWCVVRAMGVKTSL
jgi:hypothetical protein